MLLVTLNSTLASAQQDCDRSINNIPLDFLGPNDSTTQAELRRAVNDTAQRPEYWLTPEWGTGVGAKVRAEAKVHRILLQNRAVQRAIFTKKIKNDDVIILSRLLLQLPISRGILMTSNLGSRESEDITVGQFMQAFANATNREIVAPMSSRIPKPATTDVKLRDLVRGLKSPVTLTPRQPAIP